MSTHRQTTWAILAVAGSATAALMLHAAPDRAAAGWVALPLVLGGVSASRRDTPLPLPALLAAGVVTRVVFWWTPPHLSDDLWRYLVEGRALQAGIDVFSVPPTRAAALDPSLAPLAARVNHPELGSIYPPLALAFFRLAAALDLGMIGWRALVSALDGLMIATLARRRRLAATWWALHPLAAVEVAHGAHVDALAVAVLGLAIDAGPVGRWTGWLVSVGIKLVPALSLPSLRVRPWPAALCAAAVAAAAWLALGPARDAGAHLFDSLGAYATAWSFNSGVYPWLTPILGSWTRPVLAAALLAVALHARRLPPEQALLRTAVAWWVLTPTAHPWYALWALLGGALTGDRRTIASVSAVCLGYLVLLTWDASTARWDEPGWLWWATWGTAAALALLTPRSAGARRGPW